MEVIIADVTVESRDAEKVGQKPLRFCHQFQTPLAEPLRVLPYGCYVRVTECPAPACGGLCDVWPIGHTHIFKLEEATARRRQSPATGTKQEDIYGKYCLGNVNT